MTRAKVKRELRLWRKRKLLVCVVAKLSHVRRSPAGSTRSSFYSRCLHPSSHQYFFPDIKQQLRGSFFYDGHEHAILLLRGKMNGPEAQALRKEPRNSQRLMRSLSTIKWPPQHILNFDLLDKENALSKGEALESSTFASSPSPSHY